MIDGQHVGLILSAVDALIDKGQTPEAARQIVLIAVLMGVAESLVAVAEAVQSGQ